jgi:GDP-fucose transporter C1
LAAPLQAPCSLSPSLHRLRLAAMSNFLYIANVIAAYWVVSISMVYLNKIILSTPGSSIPAPLFITWFQCVVTCAICVLLGHVGESTRASGAKSHFNEYPLVRYRTATGLAVLPLSLVFVGMISFNNLCLQYVEVSFCTPPPAALALAPSTTSHSSLFLV